MKEVARESDSVSLTSIAREALQRLSSAVHFDQLDPDPISEKWLLSGSPCARSKTLTLSPDKFSKTMFWDCTSGSFYWFYQHHESALILSGEAHVRAENGKEHRLTAGDFVFFSAGTSATWRIDDHVRKIAFVHEPIWRFAVPAISLYNKVMRKLGLTRTSGWTHLRPPY